MSVQVPAHIRDRAQALEQKKQKKTRWGGGGVVQYYDKFMHSIVMYYIHITID